MGEGRLQAQVLGGLGAAAGQVLGGFGSAAGPGAGWVLDWVWGGFGVAAGPATGWVRGGCRFRYWVGRLQVQVLGGCWAGYCVVEEWLQVQVLGG